MSDFGKEYETRAMTKTFGKFLNVALKVAQLRYIDRGKKHYELPSLGAQNELPNPWQSPPHSVEVEVNANLATYVKKSSLNDVPERDDDWDFEVAAGLEVMERFYRHTTILQSPRIISR